MVMVYGQTELTRTWRPPRSSAASRLSGYSDKALARVWKAERFSWQLSNLMHRFPDSDALGRRMQMAELGYIATSVAARTSIAENHVGLLL